MLLKRFVYFSRASLCLAIIGIFILSVIKIDQPLPGGLSDKFYHGLAFFALSSLANISFPKSGFTLYQYLPLFLYGILIELVQYFLPYRSFSIADILADAMGIFLYYIIFRIFLSLDFVFYRGKTE